jgi:hypothetical protein
MYLEGILYWKNPNVDPVAMLTNSTQRSVEVSKQGPAGHKESFGCMYMIEVKLRREDCP